MVNRVLIRLKVVQLLYSYLLSKSEFKVEMPLETSSPDRRYAYVAYAEPVSYTHLTLPTTSRV